MKPAGRPSAWGSIATCGVERPGWPRGFAPEPKDQSGEIVFVKVMEASVLKGGRVDSTDLKSGWGLWVALVPPANLELFWDVIVRVRGGGAAV